MENTALVVPTPAAVALQDQISQADYFYKSGLFKDVTDAAQAFVKIVKGHEIGLQPMAAMEGFDIVQGRLRMTARCAAALVNVCHYAGYTPISGDDTQCTIRFHKKTREGWVDLPDVTYTIEIAKARGALDKGQRKDGKGEYDKSPEWHADPKNMLYWRAIQRGVSYYFPELMAGLEADHDYETVTDEKFEANKDDLFGDTNPAANPTPTPQDDPQATFSGSNSSTPAQRREDLMQAIERACKNFDLSMWAAFRHKTLQVGCAYPDLSISHLMEIHAAVVNPNDEYKVELAKLATEREKSASEAQETTPVAEQEEEVVKP